MIDHIGFPVSDYERAKAFDLKALAPLGAFVRDPDGHDIHAVCHAPE